MNDWFNDLVSLVSDRTGLVVRERERASLSREIGLLCMTQFRQSAVDYLAVLRKTDMQAPQWVKLLPLLTVGESYFFRDHGQHNLLRERILPQLIEQKKAQRQLRIWSAGCASGEEAYSIAILLRQLLHELGEHQQQWQLSIVATDINQQILEKAGTGLYSAWSFRQADPQLQSEYFTEHDNAWKINPEIQEMVRFEYGNLLEDPLPDAAKGLAELDLIVCRNVFIYFLPETVSQIAKKMSRCLADNGYFMSGHTDLRFLSDIGLKPEWINEQMVYRKADVDANVDANNTALLAVQSSAAATSLSTASAKSGSQCKAVVSIAEHRRKCAETAAAAVTAATAQTETLAEIAFELLLRQAKKDADKGRYELASAACRKAIKLDADSPQPYFVLAMIEEMQGNRQESKDCLNKCLYIDHQFVAAYIEFFTIYRQENNKEMARRMLHAASQIVQGLPKNTIVAFYEWHDLDELSHMLADLKNSL